MKQPEGPSRARPPSAPAGRARLDALLVERGLFPTRAKAQAAVMAGNVLVDGRPGLKAGALVLAGAALAVRPGACPYVSRGGSKLAAALDAFGLSAAGRVALDLGSSTGGFTDCLLQRGAAKVYAVDVGRAQLDLRLKADSRVVSLEETHARDLKPSMFEPRPDLAVIDVSFISLAQVLPHAAACLAPGFDIVALVKPQFELGPGKAPKGIVRLQEHRDEALARVRAAARTLGLVERGTAESPLRGAKGNVERFLWLSGSGEGPSQRP